MAIRPYRVVAASNTAAPHPVGASLALNALPTQVLELDLLF